MEAATVSFRHLLMTTTTTMMMMVIFLHTSHCKGASASLMGNESTTSILLAHQYPELELLSDSEPIRRILSSYIVPKTGNPKKPVCVNGLCHGPLTSSIKRCDPFNRNCHHPKNQKIFSTLNPNEDLVLRLNSLVDDFMIKEEETSNQNNPLEELWTPPPAGWWKLNTDAAYSNGKAGIAFITRNWKGEATYMASKIISCTSPFQAEIKALLWAAEIAEEKNWFPLLWSSDCMKAVEDINSRDEPLEWNTRYDLLYLRQMFGKNDWSLNWNPRSSNRVADFLAKKAIISGSGLNSFCIDIWSPHGDVLELLSFDLLGSFTAL